MGRKTGQFGSNATKVGAGLGLRRLTGDDADDGTNKDARGREVTGARLASGESRGWSCCWRSLRSLRSIIDRLKRYVLGCQNLKHTLETLHKHDLHAYPKRGKVWYQKLARASRRCSNCCGQQHALYASCGTLGILLLRIVLVLKRVNRHARGCRIASNWVRE